MALSFILTLSLCTTLATAIVPSKITDNVKGFNYDSADPFADNFKIAKNLPGTDGAFTSARLFTTIAPNQDQVATKDVQPLAALKAAVDTSTTLLIGLYCSSPQGVDGFNRELAALENAINADYGQKLFDDLVVGIVVGNEDLYRDSRKDDPKKGDLQPGDSIENIQNYIKLTRELLDKKGLKDKIPVGHAETWAIWTTESISSVLIPQLDFVALNSFPYWEGHTVGEEASWGYKNAIDVTVNATNYFKNNGDVVPVWATETGWPYADTNGPKGNAYAVPENTEIYWKGAGCDVLFGPNAKSPRKSWWFKLYGIGDGVDKGISWGVTKDKAGTPAFESLDCTKPAPQPVPAPSTDPGYVAGTPKIKKMKARQVEDKKPARYRGRNL